MNTVFLFVWMVVASDRLTTHLGWVNLGEFNSPQACQSAAETLGLVRDRFRCISKATGG